MTRRLAYILALLLLVQPFCHASGVSDRKERHQRDTSEYSNIFLDTVQVKRVFAINDYTLIGVRYGVGFNRMRFNPVRNQGTLYQPGYYGITISKYCKMFGYMPYFGAEAGIFYGHEGYMFKENEETGTIATVEGATQCTFSVVEVPVTAAFHADFQHFKLLLNAGIYGAYRLDIERTGEWVSPDIVNSFLETDRRLDYGLKGSLGFGLVFDPIEIHIQADVRYGWNSIYEPDYFSKYYYRFAYPLDIMATAGIYFQLGKRTGKDKAALKSEARKIVFGE